MRLFMIPLRTMLLRLWTPTLAAPTRVVLNRQLAAVDVVAGHVADVVRVKTTRKLMVITLLRATAGMPLRCLRPEARRASSIGHPS